MRHSSAASVRQAIDFVAQGQGERALPVLIDCWRVTRDPRIEDVLVELGAQAASGRQQPAGKRQKDVHAAWLAMALGTDPVEVSVLLPTLAACKSPEALARLQALAGRGADPRIGRALAAFLLAPPFQAGTTRPFWREAFAVLPQHAGRKVVETLEQVRGRFPEILRGAETMGQQLNRLCEKAVPEAKSFAECKPLDAESRTLVDDLVAAVARQRPDPREVALRGLDAVPWKKLEDAYGTAEKVEQQIRDIASDDEQVCEKAISWGFANLCHQGSVYSSTAQAVPFLTRLLAVPAQKRKADLLWLIAHCALNDPTAYAVDGGARRDQDSSDSPGDPFALCWRAVKEGAPAFLPLLDDEDPAVRRNAAFLLAHLPNAAKDVAPRLIRAWEDERDEPTRATILVALGLTDRTRKAVEHARLLQRSLADPSRLVSAAAAIATALVLGDRIDKRALDALREAGTHPDIDPVAYPFLEGAIGEHARRVERGLNLRSTEELLRELEGDLAKPSKRALNLERAEHLRGRIFGWQHRPLPVRLPEDLSNEERRLVEAMVSLEVFGLDGVGLFYNLEPLKRFLGLTPPGPLDTRVDWAVDGKLRKVPLFRAVSDVLHGLAPTSALLDALGTLPVEVGVEVWNEMAMTGAYELWRGRGHPDDVGDPYDRDRLHNERRVELLGEMSLCLGQPGRQAAQAIGRAQREMPEKHPNGARCYKSGIACGIATYSLMLHARECGQTLDPAWHPLVAETIRTPPAQRAPRVTQAVLDSLPREQAEAVVLSAAPVVRFGSISHSQGDAKSTWETIFFDDSLRYLEGFEGPATAGRVVWAIEQWARVKAQTPKGEKSLDPLPREELIAFLERCGEAARPALEASLAKNHGARSVIERALERIGSAKP
jgi:hypothetical protein